MKKNLFLAALAFVALASCTSDEFVGENTSPTTSTTTDGAISFGSSTSKITRATTNSSSATDAEKLDKQFKVYGVKSGSTAGSNLQKVFPDYGVWSPSTSSTTTSNSHGWEYVEPGENQNHGSGDNPMSLSNQTIKYWDHSAYDYRFVAGSPYKAFTFTINENSSDGIADNTIESATVTGLAGHLNVGDNTKSAQPIYIAEPLIITEPNYATGYGTAPVTFRFVRQQARVRVGIFETIPGYQITEIKFYPYDESSDAWQTTKGDNIVLASTTANYFQGGAADAVKGTINYTWTGAGAPKYSFSYGDANTSENKKLVQQKNWYGGKYNDTADPAWGEMAISSSETNIGKLYGKDNDMEATTGYFTVLPTAAATTASPLLIKCDYILTSEKDNSGETIHVYGATAAIPDAFCKWAPNTSYTYLFKISDNTNGKTATDKDAVGLFPITFNAVVVTETAGTEQGVVTTVSTPSITTYQVGSVTATGIEYKTGTDIYLTVQNNETGSLSTLYDGGVTADAVKIGAVKVYKLLAAVDADPAPTEADLQVNPPSGTDLFDLGGSAATVNNVVLPANNHGKFSPSDAGFYAIQYLTAYDAGTVLASGTSVTGYCERSGDAEPYTYTAASGTANGTKTYYKAAYTYKIVKVVAAPSSSR